MLVTNNMLSKGVGTICPNPYAANGVFTTIESNELNPVFTEKTMFSPIDMLIYFSKKHNYPKNLFLVVV